MKDLSATAYLTVSLDEDGQLHFPAEVTHAPPAARHAADMTDVLREPKAVTAAEVLYRMYRDIRRVGDGACAAAVGLRYDLTVLRPGALGGEAAKTYGHYHPVKPGTDTTYPEVYEVIHGRAHYLLQKPGREWDTIDDAVLVAAEPGDKVVIPPNYGHVTINPGDDFLVMANWVALAFASDYAPYQRLHGGAYYELADGMLLPNDRYRAVPPLRRVAAAELPRRGIPREVPLYRAFLDDPAAFAFLV